MTLRTAPLPFQTPAASGARLDLTKSPRREDAQPAQRRSNSEGGSAHLWADQQYRGQQLDLSRSPRREDCPRDPSRPPSGRSYSSWWPRAHAGMWPQSRRRRPPPRLGRHSSALPLTPSVAPVQQSAPMHGTVQASHQHASGTRPQQAVSLAGRAQLGIQQPSQRAAAAADLSNADHSYAAVYDTAPEQLSSASRSQPSSAAFRAHAKGAFGRAPSTADALARDSAGQGAAAHADSSRPRDAVGMRHLVVTQAASGSDDSSMSLASVHEQEKSHPQAKRQRIDAGSPVSKQVHLPQPQHVSLNAAQPGSSSTDWPRNSTAAGLTHREGHSGCSVRNLKEAAAREVKALLKPLLEQGQLDKEQFKKAARAATHGLYAQGSTDRHQAAQALGEVLCEMDLPDAAKVVLLAA